MAGHSGMYGKGSYTLGRQVLHLVLHEGDERGDDERNTVCHQSRNLETD